MKKLLLSFSGGRSSAYMTKWMLENKRNEYSDIKVIFANTGQEHDKTLDFVDRCDKAFGFDVVWVEAVVNPQKGIGTSFRFVSYETASRDGEPFESVIQKYGIPNMSNPMCTRELKLNPIKSYLRSVGWINNCYETALGIRIDEVDRISSAQKKERIIYPLIEYVRPTKHQINDWWKKQSFDLDLLEHQGNCKWCWKKSKRKLLTLARENPEIFDFPAKMEAIYGFHRDIGDEKKQVFFRNHMSAAQLLEEAKGDFKPFDEGIHTKELFDFELDVANGCSESCELF